MLSSYLKRSEGERTRTAAELSELLAMPDCFERAGRVARFHAHLPRLVCETECRGFEPKEGFEFFFA